MKIRVFGQSGGGISDLGLAVNNPTWYLCVLLSALCLKDCAAGKWCNALGGISFEMYLWHFPMLILWDFVKDRVCMEERIWMAVFTVLVFILSAILYVAAEIPLTRRLDRLRDKDA